MGLKFWALPWAPLLPRTGLENLKTYKVSTRTKSIIWRYVMDPAYVRLESILPRNISANVLTLLGFISVLIPYFLYAYYLPDIKDNPPFTPSWLYLLGGLGIFGFMTFDAIDGKHARATLTMSPLGELFDHGCDSMTVAIAPILVTCSIQMGKNYYSLFIIVLCSLPLFMQYWEENYTHQLYWGYWSNAIEGTLLVIGFCFTSFFLGPQFWQQDVMSWISPVAHLIPPAWRPVSFPLSQFIFYVYILAVVPALIENVRAVIRVQKAAKASLGHAFGELTSYILFHVLFFSWTLVFDPTVFFRHIWAFLSLYVVLNANLTMWKMIAKNSKERYPLFFTILLPLLLPPAVWGYYRFGVGVVDVRAIQTFSDQLLYIYLAVATVWHISDYARVILMFSSFLGIPCLSMPPKPAEGEAKQSADKKKPEEKTKDAQDTKQSQDNKPDEKKVQ